VTCGATAGREVQLKLWPLFVKEQSLVGSYGRNRADIEATLQWAARGKIKAAIHRSFSLGETAAAFAQLRERKVMGKLIVVP
jgi:alcohol dehydrogenase